MLTFFLGNLANSLKECWHEIFFLCFFHCYGCLPSPLIIEWHNRRSITAGIIICSLVYSCQFRFRQNEQRGGRHNRTALMASPFLSSPHGRSSPAGVRPDRLWSPRTRAAWRQSQNHDVIWSSACQPQPARWPRHGSPIVGSLGPGYWTITAETCWEMPSYRKNPPRWRSG